MPSRKTPAKNSTKKTLQKKRPAKSRRKEGLVVRPLKENQKLARGWDVSWHESFLTAFRNVPTLRYACEVAKVERNTVYRHRREMPEFASAYLEAEKEGLERIETNAMIKANKGDTVMQIFMLKSRIPDKYGERTKSMNVNVNLDLAALTDGQLNMFEKFIREGYSEQQAFLMARSG